MDDLKYAILKNLKIDGNFYTGGEEYYIRKISVTSKDCYVMIINKVMKDEPNEVCFRGVYKECLKFKNQLFESNVAYDYDL